MQVPVRFDRFEIRPAERQLLVDGAPVAVGARALDLLLCLVAHRDRVMSKAEILDLVWPGLVVEDNNLSVQVSALRKILGAEAIATVPGRGYRFCLPVRSDDAPGPGLPTPVPAPQPVRPTIAVLPLRVLSDDPHLAHLADGLAEDVIALLARVPGFMLISRASSFMFRGAETSVPEVARQLGVRHVVEGSVRSVGDAVRVTTQLIDAATGLVLWSGRFDRRRDQAMDLQEDIARGIISELEPELTRAEIAHIRRQRPENLDAWAYYHQAIGALSMQGWCKEAMDDARAQLQKSLELDPRFGLAHAHYALLAALSINIGQLPHGQELVAHTVEAANRAIALDDGNSEVLGFAGCALCDLGQHERGFEVLRRALDIDPSNAQAHVALGASMALTGQTEPGIAQMRHGMAISPRDRRLGFWGWALGIFLMRAGRLEDALTEARIAARRDPKFPLPRVLEATLLDRLGQPEAARQAIDEAYRLCPNLSSHEVALTHGRRVAERLTQLRAAVT